MKFFESYQQKKQLIEKIQNKLNVYVESNEIKWILTLWGILWTLVHHERQRIINN